MCNDESTQPEFLDNLITISMIFRSLSAEVIILEGNIDGFMQGRRNAVAFASIYGHNAEEDYLDTRLVASSGERYAHFIPRRRNCVGWQNSTVRKVILYWPHLW